MDLDLLTRVLDEAGEPAYRARQAWASYWNWDPKEVWTFVIWVVYAAYLHARATTGISRQKATYIALAGFACIIINYSIVNMYFVGQHSYSGV